MSHEYRAQISWSGGGEGFERGRYSREHVWRFDCGIEVAASPSPHVVPPPYSTENAVDPEEAYVASIASCHMLTFLYLASRKRLNVLSYVDEAVGLMEKNPQGKLAVTRVTLRPVVEFQGQTPSEEELREMHHTAHQECYIANSVRTEIVVELGGADGPG